MNKISYRVSKIQEFEDAVFYRAECACGSLDHNIDLELSYSEDISDMLTLNLYQKLVWSSYWETTNIFSRLWKRIKGSLTLLFRGYIEMEQSFLFQGEDHVQSFIDALNEGLEKVKGK
jgi:hypothetical protein